MPRSRAARFSHNAPSRPFFLFPRGLGMKRVVVSALLGVALVASAAQAQDRYETVVRNQLREAGRVSEDRGFQMSHDIYMGRLDDDATTNVNVTLDGGKDYVIVG